MGRTRTSSRLWSAACVMLLALASGCATRTQLQDVGAVVVPPQRQLSPVPAIVQQTLPKPAGYFQRRLLDYSQSSPEKPTRSIPPTSAAGATPRP